MSILFSILLVILTGISYSLYGFLRQHLQLLKYPKVPLPFHHVIGHVGAIPKDASKFFWSIQKFSNELFESTREKLAIFWIGMTASFIVIHPDSAEVILKSHTNIRKSQIYDYLRPWIGDGLVTSTGKKWHKRRKMITPSFHFDILKDFLYIMNEHSSFFVESIDKLLSEGKKFDLQQMMDLLTLDIICESAMGIKLHALEKKGETDYVKAVQQMSDFVHMRVVNPLIKRDYIFNRTKKGKEQQKEIRVFHKLARDVIDLKMKEKAENRISPAPKRKAFLDTLLEARAEDGTSLTVDGLLEEVDTFMVTAHSATTNVFMWAIYVLGRNLDKQRKLQEELDSVFGDDRTCDITYDHIKDLHYLNLVVKESLRMYPSAPLIARNLDEDCVIDGWLIPKGHDVTINIFYIHRHPEVWDRPNEFIPERFENRDKSKFSPYSYIPFSAGPRNCIGRRYAVQKEKVVLAKFFRQFSVVSYDEEEDIAVNSDIVFQIDSKLNIKIEKRKLG